MTQLTDVRKIVKVKLPSFPDVEAQVFDGLLTGQIGELQLIENDYEKGIKTLEFLVKSWSFVDAEEKPLPVSIENLKLLPMADFTKLMDTANESMIAGDGKKKKS